MASPPEPSFTGVGAKEESAWLAVCFSRWELVQEMFPVPFRSLNLTSACLIGLILNIAYIASFLVRLLHL